MAENENVPRAKNQDLVLNGNALKMAPRLQ